MKELLRRLSYLWNRRRLEREMAEEMAYHRELLSADRRTHFGDDLRLREDAREMWGWTWLDRPVRIWLTVPACSAMLPASR